MHDLPSHQTTDRISSRGVRQATYRVAQPQPTNQFKTGRVLAMQLPSGLRGDSSVREDPFVKRLTGLADLSASELALIRRLAHFTRTYPANTEITGSGDVKQPRILLSGWACNQQVLRSGRRQIIRFLVPGDLIGSMDRPIAPAVSTIVALTPLIMADARPLWEAINVSAEPVPGLASAVQRALHSDAMGLRDQIVRLGGRAAYERLIHLVLELHERLRAVGLAPGNSFDMPVTQEMLADALGMSFVHTNRTLQQIKQEGLFVMRGGQVTIGKMEQMCLMADRQAT